MFSNFEANYKKSKNKNIENVNKVLEEKKLIEENILISKECEDEIYDHSLMILEKEEERRQTEILKNSLKLRNSKVK